MKHVEITLSIQVEDHATVDQIEFLAGSALVQVEEPHDDEGDEMPFFTQAGSYSIKVDGETVID